MDGGRGTVRIDADREREPPAVGSVQAQPVVAADQPVANPRDGEGDARLRSCDLSGAARHFESGRKQRLFEAHRQHERCGERTVAGKPRRDGRAALAKRVADGAAYDATADHEDRYIRRVVDHEERIQIGDLFVGSEDGRRIWESLLG